MIRHSVIKLLSNLRWTFENVSAAFLTMPRLNLSASPERFSSSTKDHRVSYQLRNFGRWRFENHFLLKAKENFLNFAQTMPNISILPYLWTPSFHKKKFARRMAMTLKFNIIKIQKIMRNFSAKSRNKSFFVYLSCVITNSELYRYILWPVLITPWGNPRH